MRLQLVATALALCASATQLPLNPLRPARENVFPGASLTADSQLELASIGTEFVEITHAAFPVRRFTADRIQSLYLIAGTQSKD